MSVRVTSLILCGALLGGCASNNPQLADLKAAAESALSGESSSGPLSIDEITRGLKEALTTGSNAVVAQLGKPNGFSDDPIIHIPLPSSLAKARDFASKVGLEGSFDDLELKLNQAAEQATPKAQALFVDAISEMSVDDAKGILSGPDDAATSYFRDKTGSQLQSQMRPIIDQALASVGAVGTFNDLLSKYNNIPLAPKLDADLTGYVTEEGSEGIFHYLAEEEKAIRENPLKRTSEILRRVFGS
ncbi:DUF4197 domain-containing protein [Granulosicoccus antarcticus]|uniref:DUF4197 domain-containing protein n=1 Tax=Granulosicoccus antarcticus IMCC3135 TaxID=1192854 RepID=A0A2Z2NJD2_9GAMM|nr:DUF4197 domain-containing protein [Granulosicoccus antarcticus]ASJ71416.1 hypothetical protein IMCC3135_06545 [Granulosicoccus antarcticus IMCC3135]